MVSDVLHEAVHEIDAYLGDDFYEGEMRDEIVRVRDEMDALRAKLDTPPWTSLRRVFRGR